MWWERNEVLWDNAVVWWLWIRMAQSLKNVFAYSNKRIGWGNFITKSSDAFYLDIQKWLWINLESNKGWVEMQWAMWFGEVDINQWCNDSSNNYGVQWTWDGCMVGCTKAWGWKWQLLDSSESCKAKCEDDSNGRCVVDVYNPSEVAWKCADSTVSIMHTTKCGTSGSYEQYKNAIFEVTLVDQWKCPANTENLGNNQCVYACDSTSHLTWDTTGKISDARNGKWCYQDCTLDGKTVKHNETLYGYQNKQVTCSNDANSPTSPQTCINHDNRAELLCVDGRWYDKTHGKWKDENKYNNKSCTLSSYGRCQTIWYKLTKSGITSTSKKYYDYNMNWNNTDRWESKGERWIYVLCKDWTANAPQLNGKDCTSQDPTQYHYRLVKCQDDYTRFSSTTNKPDSNGDQCRKNCSFNGQIFTDGGTTPWFKLADVNCAWKCESATLTCKDGTWYAWNTANADRIYSKWDCNLHDGTKCQSKFNLTVKPNSTTTKFETCVDYTADWKYKCNTNFKYHKTWCQPGYEWENCDPTWEPKCTDLPSNAKYNDSSKKPSTDTKAFYNTKSTKACAFSCKDNYKWEDDECKADNWWYQCTGEKPRGAKLVDWTDSGLTKDTPRVLKSYTYTPKSSEKCIYKCDHESKLYLIGGKCVDLNNVCDTEEKYKCNGWAEVKNKAEKDGVYTWDCEADWEVIANCTFWTPVVKKTSPVCTTIPTETITKPSWNLCDVWTQSEVDEVSADPDYWLGLGPRWHWTCTNDEISTDCYVWIPTATFYVTSVGGWSITFDSDPYSANGFDGTEMIVHIKYRCTASFGAPWPFEGDFIIPYYYQWVWQNPSAFGMCGSDANNTVDILEARVVWISSPKEKNWYRLFAAWWYY